jgi:tRNA A37 threonylcarbamoyladenosine biosynthesis protein TsaE
MEGMNVSFIEELQEIIEDENNYILIEWPEKIEDYLPLNCNEINIEHGESSNNRTLNIKYAN